MMLFSYHGYGYPAYNFETIAAQANQIVHNLDPNINIGMLVHSKKYNRTIYDLNANRAYVPASTLKVLTAIASLIYLGDTYRFSTGLYYDTQKIRGHQLSGGSLY